MDHLLFYNTTEHHVAWFSHRGLEVAINLVVHVHSCLAFS